MNLSLHDIGLIGPQLWVAALGMIVLIVDAIWPQINKRTLANLCLVGLAIAGALVWTSWPRTGGQLVLYGMVAADLYTAFFNSLFLVGSAISIFLSVDYLEREGIHHGEYYALLLFTTVGMMVMASAMNLIAIFLGLEILSISLYVMA